MAMGTQDIVVTPQKTEEELTKEKREVYLAALVREKAGLEQRLTQLTSPDAKNVKDEMIATTKADIKAVEHELSLTTGGHGGEPRSKYHK